MIKSFRDLLNTGLFAGKKCKMINGKNVCKFVFIEMIFLKILFLIFQDYLGRFLSDLGLPFIVISCIRMGHVGLVLLAFTCGQNAVYISLSN